MAQDFVVLDTSNAMSVQVSYLVDNFEALRSNFAGASAPTEPTPIAGQAFFDTDTNTLYHYYGSSWHIATGETLKTDIAAVGNVGTGEDDLISYEVAASTLAANENTLSFVAAGTFAANGNNKTLKVVWGTTTLFSTGAVAFNTGDWRITGEIIRTGASAQVACITFTSSNSSLSVSTDLTEPTEDTTTALTLKLTGEATSDDDIVCKYLKIKFEQ